eukprot:TRINITY_DN558_c0_g1_i2.p1 TRINITY_DN558_c0_g1~~TRINITY_DN558_c0_g1_i2.p1  ORF type:complete len:458 (-),score=36.67 TRINITY_DN558_c0_g1_i2:116-1489(-)
MLSMKPDHQRLLSNVFSLRIVNEQSLHNFFPHNQEHKIAVSFQILHHFKYLKNHAECGKWDVVAREFSSKTCEKLDEQEHIICFCDGLGDFALFALSKHDQGQHSQQQHNDHHVGPHVTPHPVHNPPRDVPHPVHNPSRDVPHPVHNPPHDIHHPSHNPMRDWTNSHPNNGHTDHNDHHSQSRPGLTRNDRWHRDDYDYRPHHHDTTPHRPFKDDRRPRDDYLHHKPPPNWEHEGHHYHPEPKHQDIPPQHDHQRTFRLNIIILSCAILLSLWILSCVASVQEAEGSNTSFIQELTYLPIYSIITINHGELPKIVRLHLLYVTLAIQLAVEAHSIHNEESSNIWIAIKAIMISIPFNYFFGFVSKMMKAGDNPESKRLLVIVTEALVLCSIFYINYELSGSASDNLIHLLGVFIIGFLLDSLVLDSIAMLLARWTPLEQIIKLRGFYHESLMSRLAD